MGRGSIPMVAVAAAWAVGCSASGRSDPGDADGGTPSRDAGAGDPGDAGPGDDLGLPLPFVDDFEDSGLGWTTGGDGSTWAAGAPAGIVIGAAASGARAWVTNLAGSPGDGEDSWLASPALDLSGGDRPPMLVFDWVFTGTWHPDDPGAWDAPFLTVEWSEDGGPWRPLDRAAERLVYQSRLAAQEGAAPGGVFLASSRYRRFARRCGPPRWTTAALPVPAAAQRPRVRLRFRARPGAGGFEGVGVDRVRVLPDYVDLAAVGGFPIGPAATPEEWRNAEGPVFVVNLGNVPAEATVGVRTRNAGGVAEVVRRVEVPVAALDDLAHEGVAVAAAASLPVSSDTRIEVTVAESRGRDGHPGNDAWSLFLVDTPPRAEAADGPGPVFGTSFATGPEGWQRVAAAEGRIGFVWQAPGDDRDGSLLARFGGPWATAPNEAMLGLRSPLIAGLDPARGHEVRVTLRSTLPDDDCLTSSTSTLEVCGATDGPVTISAPVAPGRETLSIDLQLDEGATRCSGELEIHEVTVHER